MVFKLFKTIIVTGAYDIAPKVFHKCCYTANKVLHVLVKTFWSSFVCEKLIITTWQHCQRALMPFFRTRFCPVLAVRLCSSFFSCFVGCPNIFYAVLLCFLNTQRTGHPNTHIHRNTDEHTYGRNIKSAKKHFGIGVEGVGLAWDYCDAWLAFVDFEYKQNRRPHTHTLAMADRNPHKCNYANTHTE